MTSDEATLAVIDALEGLGIPYMVVGSLSSNYYGVPRSTKDADFVVELAGQSPRDIADRLGPQFRLDPQMTFETVTMTTRYILDVVPLPFRVELFRLSDDAHDQERFRRRRRVSLLGREVNIPTAEDVVVTKLRWAAGRKPTKDVEDVRNVIAVQGNALDDGYIHGWCGRHGTRALLDEIRASIPPI